MSTGQPHCNATRHQIDRTLMMRDLFNPFFVCFCIILFVFFIFYCEQGFCLLKTKSNQILMFSAREIKMQVNVTRERRDIKNIIGVIRGSVEPGTAINCIKNFDASRRPSIKKLYLTLNIPIPDKKRKLT